MNSELILKVISLVAEHGDKAIFVDDKTGKGVVVLDLELYEKLRGERAAGKIHPSLVKASNSLQASPGESEGTASPLGKGTGLSSKPTQLRDLTQDQFLAKINRDVQTWVKAQIPPEIPSPNQAELSSASSTEAVLSEEERFYLEPMG